MSDNKNAAEENKLDALQDQLKKVTVLEQKLDAVTSERDKLQGTIEGLQSQLEEAQKYDVAGAVNARIALIKQAEKHLPVDFKFDGLDDDQIKAEVIKAKMPEAKLDGYNSDRLDGMYEVVLSSPAKQERTDGFNTATTIYQTATRVDADPIGTAYQAQINKMIEGRKANV